MSTPRQKLKTLITTLQVQGPGKDKGRQFGYADTMITDREPKLNPNSFYPDPHVLVTQWPGETAWTFGQLMKVVHDLGGFGMWKEEYFGRLGAAGTDYLNHCPQATAAELALALAAETADFLADFERGPVPVMTVAVDGELVEDQLIRARPGNAEEVLAKLRAANLA